MTVTRADIRSTQYSSFFNLLIEINFIYLYQEIH